MGFVIFVPKGYIIPFFFGGCAGIIIRFLYYKNTELLEKRYYELFTHISSGVAIYEISANGEDFIFKDFNLAGEKIENIKKEELIGKKLTEVFPGVKKFGLFEVLLRVWKTGKSEHHPITIYKDGRITGWRKNYIYKLRSGEIVTIYDDLTKQKQDEQKISSALNQSNFYKDLLAHDINNIFHIIKQSTQLMEIWKEDPIKSDEKAEIWGVINQQLERGTDLILNVRKLSEVEGKEIITASVDVRIILENTIEHISSRFQGEEIEIKTEISQGSFNVKAGDLLVEAFENILINGAIHNDSEKKQLWVNLSKVQEEGESFVKVEFKDNGMGIIKERKKTIFERGYKIKGGTGGMGIGLSLVKKIIYDYYGRIWVEDRIEGDHTKGSNFVVMLMEEL
jgi:signal transduction histidine kinase